MTGLSTQGEPGVRPSALGVVRRGLRRVVELTFVDPVRHGRPRPEEWPTGLRSVGVASLVLYATLALAAAFAQPLRELSLATSLTTRRTVPEAVLPLLMAGLVWTLTLAHTALIRLVWYVKLPLLVICLVAVGSFVATGYDRPLLLGVAVTAYVGLLVFVLVRGFRAYAWWEFVVIGGLLAVTMFSTWTLPGFAARSGLEPRFIGIELAIEMFSVLSFPALIVAGGAPALVTVTAAEALATRSWPKVVLAGLLVAAVVWRLTTTVTDMWTDPVEHGWRSLAASAAVLALAGGAVLLVRYVSRQPAVPRPGDLPAAWSGYHFPIAGAFTLTVVSATPIVIAMVATEALGLPGREVIRAIWTGYNSGPATDILRGLVGVALVWLAVRLARRGRTAAATALAAFGGYQVIRLLPTDTPAFSWLLERSTDGIATVSSWVAIVVLLVALVTRTLDRGRQVGVLTVLLVGGLYAFRDALDDPVSALLGFAGLGVLLFGLVWQVLTEADVTRTGTRRFPLTTRVYLFLANGVFAVCSVALAALSRHPSQSGSAADQQELGDSILGTPLLLAAVLVGLWLAVRPTPESAGSPRPAPSYPIQVVVPMSPDVHPGQTGHGFPPSGGTARG